MTKAAVQQLETSLIAVATSGPRSQSVTLPQRLLGNKAGTGRSGIDWYTSAVTRSDEITRAAIEVLNLADFPRS